MIGLFLLFLICFLGFALFGLIVAIQRLAGGRPSYQLKNEREFSAEVAATCRMLERLYRLHSISFEEYTRLRDAMEAKFPSVVFPLRLARRPLAETTTAPGQPQQVLPTIEIDVDTVLDAVPIDDGQAVPSGRQEAQPPPRETLDTVATRAGASSETAKGRTAIHPLDRSYETPAPPPRPWSDLLLGFMQEKNIRWGELASGILIVGSAVGLVVSLREQLRETIPYFPALLFMLITGAIHAAGTYTLRRWKLRNTSRGVLIIGLLLVPLNFLAACILTGSGEYQRSLSDPIYWTAVTVGMASFSVMTWFSSKYLLRRGNLPMFVAVMGCSLSMLVINRVDNPLSQSWLTIVLSLPVVVSFVTGVSTIDSRQWTRRVWSDRITYRLLLILGIAAFSLVVAVSLLVVRAARPSQALLASSPCVAVLAGMTAWLGAVIQSGTKTASLRITGTSLLVLGLVVVTGLLVVTIVNPTLQLIICIVAGPLLAG